MITSAILSFLIANLGPILGTAATALGAWAVKTLSSFASAWIDQKSLATLEKALVTGLINGLSQGQTGAQAVAGAVAYSKNSSPGAIQRLGATESVLLAKGTAMLHSLVTPDLPSPPAPGS